MRLNSALWAFTAAFILTFPPTSFVLAKNDISKGTEVIEPGSKEAEALHAADKASKFAPKDNTYIENFDKGSTFKKPELKLLNQKIDVPNSDPITSDKKQKVAATKDDKTPVVVNDYDPNNMGVPSEGKTKAQKLNVKESEAGLGEAGLNGPVSPNLEPASSKDTTLVRGTGINPEEAAAAVAAGAAALASGAGPDGSGVGSPNDLKKLQNIDDESFHKKGDEMLLKPTPFNGYLEKIRSSGEEADALHALAVSVSLAVISEIGDRTFLIAAILAMRYKPSTVFSGVFAALSLMTIVSSFIGQSLFTISSNQTPALISGFLFMFFGVKSFHEGLAMKKNTSTKDELRDTKTEINTKVPTDDLELGFSGDANSLRTSNLHKTVNGCEFPDEKLSEASEKSTLYRSRPKRSSSGKTNYKSVLEGLGNLFGLVLSPIWVQAFAMSFFAGWGGKSQIATAAMAVGSDYWWVIIGSIFGHFMCTGTAVIGGKLLATKIVLRTLTLAGAVLFIFFSLIYFWEYISK